ncbi:hypothetical protein OSB04_004040 [Centaurea solstitialis]|uniref:Potassium channel domain-containing protein n=1 Tax=Centaurea solstitialis TaxID=347529 RepID=A0AA38TXT2_9ASTR|nr:hypothetical protein OSB04_004040 [Centaurea solstitialis]
MDIGHLESGLGQVAMTTIGGNQSASPIGVQEPSLTKEEIKPLEPSLESTTCTLSSGFELMRKLRKVSIILYIYMGAGTICFYLIRHHIKGKKTNGVLDAFYFTIVLMTSIKYGDLCPDSTLAILLASLFALMGTLLMALLVSIGAQVVVKQSVKQKKLLRKHGVVGTTEARMLEQRKSTMKYMCIALVVSLVVLVLVGTIVLVSLEDLDNIHAFYCIFATITSVGSDNCFSTKSGRVFAIFWMLLGTFYLALAFLTFAELYAQRKQKSFEKSVLQRTTTPEDFHEADLDGDRVLSISEYTLHKLSEMGRFNQEDMAPIMEEFRRLDVNGKGALTLHEIKFEKSL